MVVRKIEINDDSLFYSKPETVTAALQTYAIKSDFIYLDRRGSTA